MSEDPEEWLRLRRDQEDVVSVRQLRAQGVTEAAVRANVDARRWQPLFRGVFALVTGEPTPAMWRRAALLFVPGPAALSHGSAAAVLGLRGSSDVLPVHLTVPIGSSARACPGIVAHRSRAFAHIVAPGTDPPVTTRAHTLIDLAVAEPDARSGLRVLTSGAARARVPGARIAEALELRPPRRYRRALADGARLLTDGVGSVLEADYALDVEQAHGLPSPSRQVRRTVDGHRIAEDVEYDLPGGTLTVRLDGWAHHRDRRTAHADRRRDNAAELEGRARLVFGYEEVHGASCSTAATIAARLAQLGWTGRRVPCPACEYFPRR